jgi:hypothetical protein
MCSNFPSGYGPAYQDQLASVNTQLNSTAMLLLRRQLLSLRGFFSFQLSISGSGLPDIYVQIHPVRL